MHINEAGLNLIKSFEGCKLVAYKCPAGVWTIGYGHTAGVTEGMVITQEVADHLLKSDMKKYENYVSKYCNSICLNTNEFSALVSFCYNCGAGNLKKLVSGRTKPQIADAMLLYNKGGGRVLKGLVRRRKAERELFLSTPNAAYIIRRGSKGVDVKDIQRLLIKKGYDAGSVDGKFGPKTERAVKAFQSDNDLKVDGIVGPKTLAKLTEMVV